MDYSLEFVNEISKIDEEKMEKDLVAYESSHGIDVNYKRFYIVLRDDQGELFGALNAYTAFAEIYVDQIWVERARHKMGYGRKLLEALETNFKGKGYNNINLVTTASHAPGFYEKCGYQKEFVRVNKKNPRLTKTFYVKFFDEEEQTQGILC